MRIVLYTTMHDIIIIIIIIIISVYRLPS